MDIFLHNTLTGKKEKFVPLKEAEVKMYNCGPTVYDYQHIGNFRAFVFDDLLRRMFEFNGYKVRQIINITDIGHLSGDNDGDADEGEDRMTKALKREGKPLTLEAMKGLAVFYANKFKEDLEKLNIKTPEKFPFASEHIEEDKKLIQELLDKDLAYKTSDGIYFDTSKDGDYGKLGGSFDEDHSRIGINKEKRNSRDFALWKFNNELGYDAPWGGGFPGWHIECSAMAMKYLGETLDVHTGGIEHIAVHHNNEIAQSESATGKEFAHYWLHNNHLLVDGGKMSKSLGNVYLISDIAKKGYEPAVFRYFLLGTHYKNPINFTWDALDGASNALKNLKRDLSKMLDGGEVNTNFAEKFKKEINDDLNTPRALAVLFEVLKSDIGDADKKATILKLDEVLGLNLKEALVPKNIPEEITKLSEERELSRKNKDFKKSDEIREKVLEAGYLIEDTESGPRITKK